MTVAAAYAAYELARATYDRAAENLRAAIELETTQRFGSLPPPILALVHAVAAEWRVPAGLLLGRRRPMECSLPRHALYALASEISGEAASVVGRYFDRDCKTITWSVRAFRDLCATDARYAAHVSAVRAAFKTCAERSGPARPPKS